MINAHFAAAIPNFRIMEFEVDDVPWREELVSPNPVVEDVLIQRTANDYRTPEPRTERRHRPRSSADCARGKVIGPPRSPTGCNHGRDPVAEDFSLRKAVASCLRTLILENRDLGALRARDIRSPESATTLREQMRANPTVVRNRHTETISSSSCSPGKTSA